MRFIYIFDIILNTGEVMKNIICAAMFIAMSAVSASGQKISGRVVDEAGDGISYVSIGILNSTTGTVSDRNGNFTLTLPDNVDPATELCFSHISYVFRSFAISGIKGNDAKIVLTPADYVIEEIMVFGGKAKESKFTRKGMRIPAGVAALRGIGSEIGSVIDVIGKIMLSRIDFNVAENTYDKVRIRVNVYRIDSDLPGLSSEDAEEETEGGRMSRAEMIDMVKGIAKDLENPKKINLIDSILLVNILHVPIYCDIPAGKKTREFSVSPNENLVLNSGRYYISLEIVELEGEGMLYFPAFLHKSYYRTSSMGGIQKYPVNIGLSVKGYKLKEN